MLVNEQYVIAAITATVSIVTFLLTTNDKGRLRDREARERAEQERDLWRNRAEAAERRADDYANRYFKLLDERRPPQ